MSDELNIEQVMSRRFELVEEIAIIQGKHKAELEGRNEELGMCETFIQDQMNKGSLQQVKTAAGHMAFFQAGASSSVEDFELLLSYIQENDMWHLLPRAVNKTAVKEIVAQTNMPPPGVKYETFRSLQWRRGKGV